MKLANWIALLVVFTLYSSVASCAPPTKSAAEESHSTAGISENNAVKDVVEGFGQRLQNVSLQSPDAAKQIQAEYAALVAPALIGEWASNLSHAPGRVVSSPWPDAIEITSIDQVASTKYSVSGNLLMMTSMEVGTGRVAGKTPIRLVLEQIQGRWMITEYGQVK